ncbi:UNVERIFIED_CONTAM: hypothetical protein ABID98_000012 [Brevibacillus sp. OAP136]
MIVITLMFCAIFWIEWRYMKKNHRKPRTIRIVTFSIFFMYAAYCALYHFRSQFSIASAIEAIFYPLEKLILWRSE